MFLSNNDNKRDGIHSGLIQSEWKKGTQNSSDGTEIEKYEYIGRGMVLHTCNLNTLRTGAEVLQVQGQPGIQSETLKAILFIVEFQ